MEYTLDIWQTLGAMFIANNIVSTILVLMIILIVAVIPVFIYKVLRKTKDYRDTRILLIGIYIVMIMIIPLKIFGSGWRIDGDMLHIKASECYSKVNIHSMEVAFVDIYGEWKPTYRDSATGLPSLLAGKCHLQNKKSAIVFLRHHTSKVLLIYSNQTYYIIGHPGVENLYDKLIGLGAKKRKE